MQRHHSLDGLRPTGPDSGVLSPRPQPAVRFLQRDVLAPLLVPSREMHANVVLVAQHHDSLEPLPFIVRRVDFLPLLQRHHKSNFRGIRWPAKSVCGGAHYGDCGFILHDNRETRGGRRRPLVVRRTFAAGLYTTHGAQ